MPRVIFTANLLRYFDSPDSEVDASTVGAALEAVFAQHPQARDYVLDEQGGLRRHVVIFVDGARLRDRRRLSDPVGQNSQIHVLQALSGG